MIHFLAFYVKRLKKAHFKEFYSTKRSTFQNFYANRLESKNFYCTKSALFRISMQMKIHLLYGWINLMRANPPPPPHYRNNLYKITYVINFSTYSLKIKGGGFNLPPLIYLPQVWRGGGVATPSNPPTLAFLAHQNISIHSFIVFVYVFIYSFIHLFIHSQWYFNLFLYRSVVHVHVYYNTK